MLDLRGARRVVVVGGGTAGWFAALEMRRTFPEDVEVVLVESEQLGIIGAGEGSIPNMVSALARYGIDAPEFVKETQATYKLGVAFEGWRTGTPNDTYFHYFSTQRGSHSLLDWQFEGGFPASVALLAAGDRLDHFPWAHCLVERRASQTQIREHIHQWSREPYAYHFDARRLAAYLSKKAQERGVRRVEALVLGSRRDSNGNIEAILTAAGGIDGDFFVDASGFRRILIQGALHINWQSFRRYLVLDAAIPFFRPLPTGNPPLVTRSTAMNHGWQWTIPTLGRLGCGYVYSSAHADETQILDELAQMYGAPVEPLNRLRFEPGRVEDCLSHNVFAIGLAAGFVEPLEATSIAHTLYQLRFIGSLLDETQRLLTGKVCERLNLEVAGAWDGIVDFLVMHYDTSLKRSQFWRDLQFVEQPESFRELKSVFQYRTPRHTDLVPYQMGGQLLFGIPSWEMVASAMGLLSSASCEGQLRRMDGFAQETARAFVAWARAAPGPEICQDAGMALDTLASPIQSSNTS